MNGLTKTETAKLSDLRDLMKADPTAARSEAARWLRKAATMGWSKALARRRGALRTIKGMHAHFQDF